MNDTAGCPTGFVGKFSFEARLTNTTKSVTLSDLTLRVSTLTNGNFLENADGGIGGVGAALAIAKAGSFSDGLLVTGEFVDQPITICLKNKKQFSFFVDVRGIQSGNVTAAVAQR